MGSEIMAEMIDKIKAADMVLIGLGEEFDDLRSCKGLPGYMEKRAWLENSAQSFWVPAYDAFCRKKQESNIQKVLGRLTDLLADKNYFVVATSTNDELCSVPWREGRFVAVCGGCRKKQCIHRCEEGLADLAPAEQEQAAEKMRAFWEGELKEQDEKTWGQVLGLCPKCGGPLIFNNIYTEFYDENGYLPEWGLYRKWLQGTMNKKLLILEFGVGLQCPTVIRWPFEKLALYNQKADIYRVHENLYQLPEELQGKGVSISENSIDWLQILC